MCGENFRGISWYFVIWPKKILRYHFKAVLRSPGTPCLKYLCIQFAVLIVYIKLASCCQLGASEIGCEHICYYHYYYYYISAWCQVSSIKLIFNTLSTFCHTFQLYSNSVFGLLLANVHKLVAGSFSLKSNRLSAAEMLFRCDGRCRVRWQFSVSLNIRPKCFYLHTARWSVAEIKILSTDPLNGWRALPRPDWKPPLVHR